MKLTYSIRNNTLTKSISQIQSSLFLALYCLMFISLKYVTVTQGDFTMPKSIKHEITRFNDFTKYHVLA